MGEISRTFSGMVSGFSTKFSTQPLYTEEYSPPMRSAMWHSGRKHMRSSSSLAEPQIVSSPRISVTSVRWLCITPLGLPVVPEV